MEIIDLSDGAVLRGLKSAVEDERRALTSVLCHLAEVERRRLYEKEGFTSLFDFCVRELHYAEAAAYKRITAMRLARKTPEVLSYLTEGRLSLGSVSALAARLTGADRVEILARAEGKTVRQAEELAAELSPVPDKRDWIRSLPEDTSRALVLEEPRESVKPLSRDRFHFSFTGSRALKQMLDRAGELLRHQHPQGRIEDVIATMAEIFLKSKDPDLRTPRPPKDKPDVQTSQSRAVPQAVKDAVWARDEGRCAYVSAKGRRCGSRSWLEYDHKYPWAHGGSSTDPENIRLLCRTHNQMTSRDLFGVWRVSPRGEPGDNR